MQELWDHGSFHLDFKERLGRQEACGRIRIPAKASAGKAMCEAVKVNGETAMETQEVRDVRNVEHFLRKVTGR